MTTNIIINDRKHLGDFIQLNEYWIRQYFSIEPADFTLAARPEQIIDDGGFVFSLLVGEEVAGVCALFNNGNAVYELARMAVKTEHQGKGYGDSLMQACLLKLRTVNATKVYLLSNHRLVTAISLYKKYGFEITSRQQHSVYSRANIVMELAL